jgi:hypothetical protein
MICDLPNVGRIICLAAMPLLAGCDETAYTLYRGSVTGPLRIHVGTFDAAQPEGYNRENCEIARSLFQAQPGVTVKYWCEKGEFQE